MGQAASLPFAGPQYPRINRRDPQASGLVLAVPLFDGGSTTKAREIAGKYGDFTFNGTCAWAKQRYGTCLDLSGGGYLSGDNVSLPGPDITITAWLSNRKATGYASIMETSGMQFCVYADASSTSLQGTLYTAGGAAATSGKTFSNIKNTDSMFFAAMRWRASDTALDFCINGEFDKGYTRGLSISAEAINIGRFPGFGAFNADGRYRDIRVYNRFLSDAEILRIYNRPMELYRTRPLLGFKLAASPSRFFKLFH